MKTSMKRSGGWLLAASCASILTIAPQALAKFVPGAVNDHVPLGTAYNRFSGKFLNFQTIKGEVQEDGNTASNIVSKNDLNFRQLSSRLSGDLTIELKFPAIQADAGASVALESASDNYTSNYIYSVINKSKSQVLRGIDTATSPVLSEAGQIIADQYDDGDGDLSNTEMLQRVGTDYVSEIEYGSQLFVSMKMAFLNETDKKDISGALSIDAYEGTVSINGDLETMSSEIKKSVKITVSAHQFGGDPLGLLTILPDNILSCDLDTPTACLELFENAVNYGKGAGKWYGEGFKDQVILLADANVIGYQTSAYDEGNAQMGRLVPKSYSVDNNSDIIEELELLYVDELKSRSRAQAVLKHYGSYLTSTQRTELTSINQATTNNAFALASLSDYCRDNYTGGDCDNHITKNCPVIGERRNCLETYDTAVFATQLPETLFLPLKSQYGSNKCLDVAGAVFSNGTNIQVDNCHGGDGQQWYYDPQTEMLETANGFCLDNTGGRANRTNVHLWICNAGNYNQKWYWDEQGRLISRKSGLALDYNYITGNAYQYIPHGVSNQKWTVD